MTRSEGALREACNAQSGPLDLKRPLLLDDLVGLKLVAHLDVVEVLHRDAALISALHLLDIVLESFQRSDLTFVDHNAVADNTDAIVAVDLAINDVRAGHCTHVRHLEDVADLGRAQRALVPLGREQAFERVAHVFDRIVDDRVRQTPPRRP